MGDRAFARARAAGKNETEAGHARAKVKSRFTLLGGKKAMRRGGGSRAKAEAEVALSLPAEYRD